MKLQIRNNVFETNSSSTHSITVAKSDYLEDLIPRGTTLYFTGNNEFGWEWEEYTDPESKASYLWISIISNIDIPRNKEMTKQKLKDRINKYISKISEYLKEEDIVATFDMPQINYYGYYAANVNGYIDHAEGLDGFADEILKTKEMFLNYLFNPISIIQTGNDNDERELDIINDPNEILLWEKDN